jgi:hypothetical protein
MAVTHSELPARVRAERYELYTISGAPRPWRVALALVAKSLPFESRVLEASKKEQKAPANSRRRCNGWMLHCPPGSKVDGKDETRLEYGTTSRAMATLEERAISQ